MNSRLKHFSLGTLHVMSMAFPFPTVTLGGGGMDEERKPLVDFADMAEVERWQVVTDGVMGGLSLSRFDLGTSETVVFAGQLSLDNNGGFAAVRREPATYGLADYTGVVLQVKGDGRTYQFRVQTDDRFDGIAYRVLFRTDQEQGQAIPIAFKSFQPFFRGRPVPYAPELRPENIRQIGFLIADKREGPFRIEIQGIEAYRSPRRERQAAEAINATAS